MSENGVLRLSKVERNVKSEDAITCLHGSGNTVFVGHKSGEIIAYSVRETGGEDGRSVADFWTQTAMRGSIECLGSASALARLFVLFDHHFWLLHLHDLSPGKTKLRHITCFATNEAPHQAFGASGDDPFSVQIAFGSYGRERNGLGLIKLALIGAERITFTKDITVEAAPIAIGVDGSALCFGTPSGYFTHDIQAGDTISLFPFHGDQNPPIVHKIDKEEFVVSGMEGLGVFVSRDGISRRAPFHWALEGLRKVAFFYPYIVAVGEESITVHSVVEEKLKQEISLGAGVWVENCDGQLFVATTRAIYRLTLLSWLLQVPPHLCLLQREPLGAEQF